MRGLIKFAVAVTTALALASICSASAINIYIAQNTAGSANGADCADAYAVMFFNTPGNWGMGATQIGPGTTVHLCGTIASPLAVQGSGASGLPVTVLFENGAKISLAAGTAIALNGNSYITVDGGSPCGPGTSCSSTDSGTGIIENTANGTGLANKVAVEAITGSGAGNIEIRDLIIRNFYVHTSTSDTTIDQTLDTCYYANGTGAGTISFHDNTVHDVGWCVEFQGYNAAAPTINVYHNYFYNYDHGVAIGANSTTQYATVNIHDNHFGTTSNWDTTANVYHHDGTHFYNNVPPWPSGWSFNIYNNLFDGNWGINNTAHVFTEETPPNIAVYNNVFIQASGNLLNNGFLNAGGPGEAVYNNTFLGSSVNLSDCVNLQGTSVTFKNNLLTSCNTFISSGPGFTFASGGLSNNIYAAVATGGNGPFNYQGNNEATFVAWQTATGQDAAPSAQVSSANLSNSGIPQNGSAVIGAGLNLTSLGITALDNDTSAGNTRTPVARPSSGAWGAGAYQFVGGLAPPPPANLLAIAH
ncbi:MAG: hypothetical protein ACYDBL_09050 [Candidatus Acidiferrales bacterium]